MANQLPNVGAQDPELKNSPVAREDDEEFEVLKQEVPREPGCFFNGQRFPDKAIVHSGTGLLRCDRGIWVEAGPSDPENP